MYTTDMKKVIGIDFDDVISSYMEGFLAYYNEKYKASHKHDDMYTFDLSEILNCSEEENYIMRDDHYESHYHDSTPEIHEAKKYISLLAEEYELVIITARPPYQKEKVLMLAKEILPHIKEFVFLGAPKDMTNWQKKSKGESAVEHNISLFIDDSYANAKSVVEKDIPVLLFDAPWNKKEALLPLMTRVVSWEEVYREVREKITQ